MAKHSSQRALGEVTRKLATIVVGLGKQSLSDHLPALLRSQDVTIVGVCDISPAACAVFRQKFPELRDIPVETSLDKLLDKTEPAVAIVAVPHDSYVPIVTRLCERGVYFLKEKPLARNLTETMAVLTIPHFSHYGLIAAQRCYSTVYRQAKESMALLGTPYLFHGVYTLQVDMSDIGWRGSKARAGGGCLIDMGYHLANQLVWWFGMPQDVHAHLSNLAVPHNQYDVEDSATVLFRYASGLHGTLLVSRAAGEKREQYELYGSDGSLIGDKAGFVIHDRDGTVLKRVVQRDTAEMLDGQLSFFISRVRSGQGFTDVQQRHIATMKFMDRCYTAAAPAKVSVKRTPYVSV